MPEGGALLPYSAHCDTARAILAQASECQQMVGCIYDLRTEIEHKIASKPMPSMSAATFEILTLPSATV